MDSPKLRAIDYGDLIPRGSLSQPDRKNLGSSAEIAPGREECILQVKGADDTALVLTVTLTKQEEVVFAPGPLVGWPYARIQWGNAGVAAEMEVDILNGLNFPLPCSFMRIIGVNPPNAFGPIRLGAFVTYLPISRPGLRLKRSFAVDVVAPGASTPMFPVPPFAGNVAFQRTNGQSFVLHFYDRNMNELYSDSTGFDEEMDSVELAASVAGIVVQNTSFAQWDRGQLIFGLEI